MRASRRFHQLVAGGGGTKAGIPAAIAGGLKSQLEDAQQAIEDGRCEDVSGQLRLVDDCIDDLRRPSTSACARACATRTMRFAGCDESAR